MRPAAPSLPAPQRTRAPSKGAAEAVGLCRGSGLPDRGQGPEQLSWGLGIVQMTGFSRRAAPPLLPLQGFWGARGLHVEPRSGASQEGWGHGPAAPAE